MKKTITGRTAPRRRLTVTIEPATFMRLLTQAEEAEAQRHRDQADAWTERCADAGRDDGMLREHLLALLKAFTDATRPAGGLPLDAGGGPFDLQGLRRSGQAHARAGEAQPRLLAQVRAGKPVDLRIAEAAMHFFRLVLARPTLSLEHLGASDTPRLHELRRIDAAVRNARDDLPLSIYDSLSARAEEAAGVATLQDDVVFEYRHFERTVDARGVHRLGLWRFNRFKPLRLAAFPGVLQLSRACEWHEWNHTPLTRLRIWLLDAAGKRIREIEPPLRKRMDAERGVVLVEIEPEVAVELQPLLTVAPQARGLHSHEIEWQEYMVFNAADRDIVVSYLPMVCPRIVFDAALNPGYRLTVGDSPGLRRTSEGWQLDRTLMPREVLAVRFRLASLGDEDAMHLSPSGEWLGVQ